MIRDRVIVCVIGYDIVCPSRVILYLNVHVTLTLNSETFPVAYEGSHEHHTTRVNLKVSVSQRKLREANNENYTIVYVKNNLARKCINRVTVAVFTCEKNRTHFLLRKAPCSFSRAPLDLH
jgi:hypothetical protein